MRSIRKHIIIVGLLAMSITAGSCGLFRKKNRCHTCPKWNDTPAENYESMDPYSKDVLNSTQKHQRKFK